MAIPFAQTWAPYILAGASLIGAAYAGWSHSDKENAIAIRELQIQRIETERRLDVIDQKIDKVDGKLDRMVEWAFGKPK